MTTGHVVMEQRVPLTRNGAIRYNYNPLAGWSSLAARRAHNPKVAGSNPAPATNQISSMARHCAGPFALLLTVWEWCRFIGTIRSRAVEPGVGRERCFVPDFRMS